MYVCVCLCVYVLVGLCLDEHGAHHGVHQADALAHVQAIAAVAVEVAIDLIELLLGGHHQVVVLQHLLFYKDKDKPMEMN